MCAGWGDDLSTHIDDQKILGFDSTLALADAHPGIPFGQLFNLLRGSKSSPIGYIHFQCRYFEDADKLGQTKRRVADTLVRRLRQHLRSGWNNGKRIIVRKMEAKSHWETPPMQFSTFRKITDEIWEMLEELTPPDDWCPEDTNDPFIREAFSRAWPEEGDFD